MTRQAKLNDDTCEELLKLGKMGWTFDDVVNMLLKFYKRISGLLFVAMCTLSIYPKSRHKSRFFLSYSSNFDLFLLQ